MADWTASYAPDDGSGIRRRGIVYQDEVDPHPAGLGRGFVNPPLVNTPTLNPRLLATDPSQLRNPGLVGGGRSPNPVLDHIAEMQKAVSAQLGSPTGAPLPGDSADRVAAFNDNNARVAANSTGVLAPSAQSIRGAGAGRGVVNPAPAPVASAAAPVPTTSAAPTPAGDAGIRSSDTGVTFGPTLDADTQLALSAAKSAAAGRVDPGVSGGGVASLGNNESLHLSDSVENQGRTRAMQLNDLERQSRLGGSQHARGLASEAYAKLAGQPLPGAEQGSAERIAAMRERGETIRATAANALQRQIHSDANAVSLRGQDTQLAGHKMANDVAIAQGKRDQFNKDRAYDLDAQKYGKEVADTNLKQRQDSEKATHDFITSALPPGPDGKPDTNTAARYVVGMNTMLTDHMNALKGVLAKDPNNKAASEDLKQLQDKGLAAFDDSTKTKLIQGMRLNDIAQQQHSALNPFGGTAVQSSAPITSMRRKSGLISDDYVTDRGDVIPARAVDKPGSTFGLGGLRTNDFDILKR